MKTRLLLFIAVATIGFTMQSCQKEPTASFYPSSSNVHVNDFVDFINTSTEADHYLWDFGDGSPLLDVENGYHGYTAAGTYNVTLTAYSKNGKKSDETVVMMTVTP